MIEIQTMIVNVVKMETSDEVAKAAHGAVVEEREDSGEGECCALF